MFRFTDTTAHHFRPGMIFLGRDPQTGHDIGIKTERAAITIAGAGSGKNAALQIPNLLRWPQNALVIDPSGGNVEVTWQAIEAMGQQVAVLDPFHVANVPDRLRVGCNLLAAIDPASLTAREDIRVIADGLVMRHDPKHGDWADARVDVIAGVIAQVVSKAPPEHRTLADVRACLTLPADAGKDEVSQLEAFFTMMLDNPACGGLARHGGNVGLGSLKSKGGDGPISKAVPGAATDTKWIDSPAMESVLVGDFDLASLKTGRVTAFLVLPPQYLDEHGRFLRLFVLAALQAMMKGGVGGRTCLFMLDEFFSLGYMQIVEKAAGLMRKYGVILWPFLQDLGQLVKLYGPHGSETFFGNSDAHIFFGNSDAVTLNYISSIVGTITLDDIGELPPTFQPSTPSFFEKWSMLPARSVVTPTAKDSPFAHLLAAVSASTADRHRTAAVSTQQKINDREKLERAADENARRAYEHKHRQIGRPRLNSEDIKKLVGKSPSDSVARSMIVLTPNGNIFNLRLAPYFETAPQATPIPALPSTLQKHNSQNEAVWMVWEVFSAIQNRRFLGIIALTIFAISVFGYTVLGLSIKNIGEGLFLGFLSLIFLAVTELVKRNP